MSANYLIPFKARAWMDLTDRKATGVHVDSKNIRKHKNDIFRLVGRTKEQILEELKGMYMVQ